MAEEQQWSKPVWAMTASEVATTVKEMDPSYWISCTPTEDGKWESWFGYDDSVGGIVYSADTPIDALRLALWGAAGEDDCKRTGFGADGRRIWLGDEPMPPSPDHCDEDCPDCASKATCPEAETEEEGT